MVMDKFIGHSSSDDLSRFNSLGNHQENMSVYSLPPQTPLLYSNTGVCRGIPIFLIFAPKHRLWVLVRTAKIRKI